VADARQRWLVKLIGGGGVLSSEAEVGEGGNGHGVKRAGCGNFYMPGEAERKEVRGERRSAISGCHSRLRFQSRVPGR
jgi:hypothetical protein